MNTRSQLGPAHGVGMDNPFTLHFGKVIKISNEQMVHLGQLNQGYRLERSVNGDLIIAGEANPETNWRSAKLFLNMVNWAMKDHSGLAFEAGTSFVLPNGAMRSPDLAWVRKSRLVRIAIKKKQFKFLPLCPDFVLHLLSPRDTLDDLRERMLEYLENGAGLCWLLDPGTQQIRVFSKDEPEIVLDNPSSLSGEPVLRGFSLHPDHIWKTDF